MAKKTQTELLEQLVELLKPINELAKYQIQNINDEIKKVEIVNEFLKKQNKEQKD